MKHIALCAAIATLFAATQAWAVPALQVSAPAGPGDLGTYADYQSSSSNPEEEDTAITSNTQLFVAGAYGPNTLLLGGQYLGGPNWSDFGRPNEFNSQGAILVVSVPDGLLASALSTLQVGGNFAFYSDADNSYFDNNHAPLGNSPSATADFLFFNLGNFLNTGSVPDFASETGNAAGQIKTINITGFDTLSWAHFDVIALETNRRGQGARTTVAENPGSHDVTWNNDLTPPQEIPEPGTLALLGLGLLGFSALRRRNK